MNHLNDLRSHLPRLASALLLALLFAVPAGAAVTRVETSGPGGYRGILEFGTAPLVTMRPIPFTLTLLAPDGRPTTPPGVACELVMPAMPMPENRPQLTAKGNGYTGEAVFTMAGAWRVLVAVRSGQSEIDRLSFDIERVFLK